MARRPQRLRRLRDWETRLEAEMRARSAMPFAWGRHDCAMCAAGAIRAMTGVDLAKPLHGYKTARGARFRLDRHGGLGGLAEAVAVRFVMAECAPRKARRGDVVLIETERGEALGIVWLNGREAMVADEAGIEALPVALATRAWRVG